MKWSNYTGFWWRRSLGFWRALFLSMLFCSALLLPAQKSFASEPNPQIESLQLHLTSINAQLDSLEASLTSWKELSAESELRVSELQQELQGLKAELTSWQESSAASQAQVEVLTKSLQESEAKLAEVSRILRASADSWKAVADQERLVLRKWKFATILVGAGALLAGGLAGYLLGR